jgi:hypothetical protein
VHQSRRVFIGAALAAVAYGSAARAGGVVLQYRGFGVDVSGIEGWRDFLPIEDSIRHQIDTVADCGVRPEILEFFRGVSITVVPGLQVRSGEPGMYRHGLGVRLSARPQPPQQPILLHELLHAYHDLVLPDGVNNPAVMHFYQLALQYRLFDPTAHVMENQKEFFAVNASVYLVGEIDQAPGTRARLVRQTPEYAAWLGRLLTASAH